MIYYCYIICTPNWSQLTSVANQQRPEDVTDVSFSENYRKVYSSVK